MARNGGEEWVVRNPHSWLWLSEAPSQTWLMRPGFSGVEIEWSWDLGQKQLVTECLIQNTDVFAFNIFLANAIYRSSWCFFKAASPVLSCQTKTAIHVGCTAFRRLLNLVSSVLKSVLIKKTQIVAFILFQNFFDVSHFFFFWHSCTPL